MVEWDENAVAPGIWAFDVAAATPADVALLDATERARHERLRRADDRAAYALAHARLRALLARALGAEPADLRFIRERCPGCGGPHGRPRLDGTGPAFSLSHTRTRVLVAIAAPGIDAIGVDVEDVPSPAVVADLAHTLHPDETAALAALSPGERATAFARAWARKEAVLKAHGTGIALGVAEPCVGVGARPRASVHHGGRQWALRDVVLPGCAAAVAVPEG